MISFSSKTAYFFLPFTPASLYVDKGCFWCIMKLDLKRKVNNLNPIWFVYLVIYFNFRKYLTQSKT